MPRMVFCRKYQKELPGLANPPYPGAKGQDIYDHVSQKAWDEWTKQQTMLINEKHLNMMNVEHRKFLQQQMDKFLTGVEHVKVEGYVAPNEK